MNCQAESGNAPGMGVAGHFRLSGPTRPDDGMLKEIGGRSGVNRDVRFASGWPGDESAAKSERKKFGEEARQIVPTLITEGGDVKDRRRILSADEAEKLRAMAVRGNYVAQEALDADKNMREEWEVVRAVIPDLVLSSPEYGFKDREHRRLLTDEETDELLILARKYKYTPAADALVVMNIGIAGNVAERVIKLPQYSNLGLDIEDLLSVAVYGFNTGTTKFGGLYRAVYKYEKERGAKLSTYMDWRAYGAARHYAEAELKKTRRVFVHLDEGDKGLMGALGVQHEDDLSREENLDKGAQEIEEALGKLDPRERRVIESLYGLNDKPKETLEDIGASEDITRQFVWSIKERAINKMRVFLQREDAPLALNLSEKVFAAVRTFMERPDAESLLGSRRYMVILYNFGLNGREKLTYRQIGERIDASPKGVDSLRARAILFILKHSDYANVREISKTNSTSVSDAKPEREDGASQSGPPAAQKPVDENPATGEPGSERFANSVVSDETLLPRPIQLSNILRKMVDLNEDLDGDKEKAAVSQLPGSSVAEGIVSPVPRMITDGIISEKMGQSPPRSYNSLETVPIFPSDNAAPPAELLRAIRDGVGAGGLLEQALGEGIEVSSEAEKVLEAAGVLERVEDRGGEGKIGGEKGEEARYRLTNVMRGTGAAGKVDAGDTRNRINVAIDAVSKENRKIGVDRGRKGKIGESKEGEIGESKEGKIREKNVSPEILRAHIVDYAFARIRETEAAPKTYAIRIWDGYGANQQRGLMQKVAAKTENKIRFESLERIVEFAANPQNINDGTVTILPRDILSDEQRKRLDGVVGARVVYIDKGREGTIREKKGGGKGGEIEETGESGEGKIWENRGEELGQLEGVIGIGRAYLNDDEESFYRLYGLLAENPVDDYVELAKLKSNPVLFIDKLKFVLRPIVEHDYKERVRIRHCQEILLENA